MFIDKLDVFPKTHEIFVIYHYGENDESTNSCWFQYRQGVLGLSEHETLYEVNKTSLDHLTYEECVELRRQVMHKLVEGYKTSQEFGKVASKNWEKKFTAPLTPVPQAATMMVSDETSNQED